jgi:hypothetical protein
MVDYKFTLAEARETLKLIRAQIDQLRQAQAKLREAKHKLSELNRRHLNNGRIGDAELGHVQRRQRQLGETVSQIVREIHETGAVVKGIDDGLVDFPSTIQGLEIYWCWKVGEDDIEWWHPRNTGFADRRRNSNLPPGATGANVGESTP